MKSIPIKTAAELDIQREAGRRAALTLRRVAEMVKPGVTTQELDDYAGLTMKMLGVTSAFLDYMGYPAQCCISINEQVIHGIPGARKIKDGDVVSLDVGVWYRDFIGDNAMTLIVGDCSPDVRRLLTGTAKALDAGIAQCKVGNRLGDVSHAIEVVANEHRLGIVREFVGHGCGRALHEEPQIPNYGSSGRGPILQRGMVLCLEPMLNLGARAVKTLDDGWTIVARDGKPSAHFEHMVAITEAGPEILTPR